MPQNLSNILEELSKKLRLQKAPKNIKDLQTLIVT